MKLFFLCAPVVGKQAAKMDNIIKAKPIGFYLFRGDKYLYMENLVAAVAPKALFDALNDRLHDWCLPPLTKIESVNQMVQLVQLTLQDCKKNKKDFFRVRLDPPMYSFCLWS